MTLSLKDLMWAADGQLDEGGAAAAAPELEVGDVGYNGVINSFPKCR